MWKEGTGIVVPSRRSALVNTPQPWIAEGFSTKFLSSTMPNVSGFRQSPNSTIASLGSRLVNERGDGRVLELSSVQRVTGLPAATDLLPNARMNDQRGKREDFTPGV